MDKFVSDAFLEAIAKENGFDAYKRIEDSIPKRLFKVCERIGLDKVSDLIDLISDNNMEQTFTRIWSNMFMSGFIAGYVSRKEEETEK